jgi:beta-glucosidase
MFTDYGRPINTQFEEVGFAFSKAIITGLLREQLGFAGVVCTDWGLVTDKKINGQDMPARAWGVEHLNEKERVLKLLKAGCDQLGGESRPDLVVNLIEEGLIPESRIDESVRRLLRAKFALGLFERPLVDVDASVAVVGKTSFRQKGNEAQRRCFTLLTNNNDILPLNRHIKKVYVEGIDPALVVARGFEVVDAPSKAEVALLRLKTPYEARPGGFEKKFHSGSLDFPKQEKARQATIFNTVPTVVDIYLDRPAVIPEIAELAAALVASYGSSGDAFLDIVLGEASPEGKLPFDLPSSMKAVVESRSDMPFDTANPVFRFGHGLSYKN